MSKLDIAKPQRLDQKLVELLPQLSRAFAAKLVEQGKVSVNGQPAAKPGQKLRPTDDVRVDYDAHALENFPNLDLPILYEDADCIVISKPVGVLTHSKGAFNPEATVATWLNSRITNMSGERAGIVHRLDRATSGVMICAKSPAALSWLQKQFSQRRVKKTYVAIVAGELKQAHAIVDMPIERNPKAPATFRVGANGKPASTEYVVERASPYYSLLKLMPQTGRTHQLRVHLKQLEHPIIGDILYGGEPAERMFLHALSLEITLPNHQRKTFTAPLPKSFEQKMEQPNA